MSEKNEQQKQEKQQQTPATNLLVPENVPQLLWRLVSEQRGTPIALDGAEMAKSTPFAWAECSDWLLKLTGALNAALEEAESNETAKLEENGASDAPAPASVAAEPAAAAAAAAAAASEASAAEGTEKSEQAEQAGHADEAPKLRLKCSLPSCNTMSSDEKQLAACSKCKNAYYCKKECQRADWKVHKKVCKKSNAEQSTVRQLKQLACTQLLSTVLRTECTLVQALMRQRLGTGALLVGMRDFADAATDTAEAAARRQVWVTFATLDELAAVKEVDARLSDVECATREMAHALEKNAGGDVVARDFFAFVDDTGFSLCIGLPRTLSDAQREAVASNAQKELQKIDMLAIDLPSQRRFAIQFDVELKMKETATAQKK